MYVDAVDAMVDSMIALLHQHFHVLERYPGTHTRVALLDDLRGRTSVVLEHLITMQDSLVEGIESDCEHALSTIVNAEKFLAKNGAKNLKFSMVSEDGTVGPEMDRRGATEKLGQKEEESIASIRAHFKEKIQSLNDLLQKIEKAK